MRYAAGKLAHRFHLLLLLKAVLERPLRGCFQRIDDGGFTVAIFLVDGQHEKVRPAFTDPCQWGLDRRNVALTFRRLADRRFEGRPVTLDDDGQNGSIDEQPLECGGEARVPAPDAAVFVHGGDCHRSILEEPHEAYFGGPLRITVLVPCAVERQRARSARGTVGTEGDLMKETHR